MNQYGYIRAKESVKQLSAKTATQTVTAAPCIDARHVKNVNIVSKACSYQKTTIIPLSPHIAKFQHLPEKSVYPDSVPQ